MKKVTKAIFPVAGMGTRFLPATKASPKEMLPIVDKPLIQYAVEEAVAAGITDMIFITGRTKRSIEDHFDKAYELETELEARGKKELLEIVRKTVPKGVNCIYIRQSEALGLGHAVQCASHVVSDEAFAVIDRVRYGSGLTGTAERQIKRLKARMEGERLPRGNAAHRPWAGGHTPPALRREPPFHDGKTAFRKPPKPCAEAVSRAAAALFTNYLRSRYAAFAIMERRFR